jgi:hypothetical protein
MCRTLNAGTGALESEEGLRGGIGFVGFRAFEPPKNRAPNLAISPRWLRWLLLQPKDFNWSLDAIFWISGT